jgi:hypothetical protein
MYFFIDGDRHSYVLPWGVNVDPDDHILVAGRLLCWGGPGDGWDEDADVYVLEYTFNGFLLNDWEFDYGQDMYEDIWDFSVDNEGNVILTGTVADQHGYGDFGDAYTSNDRAYVAKFNDHGTLLLIKEDWGVYRYRTVTSGGVIAGYETIITTSILGGQFTFYVYNSSDGQMKHCFSKGTTSKAEEAQSLTFDYENNLVATGVRYRTYPAPEFMYTMKVNVTFSLLENEPI